MHPCGGGEGAEGQIYTIEVENLAQYDFVNTFPANLESRLHTAKFNSNWWRLATAHVEAMIAAETPSVMPVSIISIKKEREERAVADLGHSHTDVEAGPSDPSVVLSPPRRSERSRKLIRMSDFHYY